MKKVHAGQKRPLRPLVFDFAHPRMEGSLCWGERRGRRFARLGGGRERGSGGGGRLMLVGALWHPAPSPFLLCLLTPVSGSFTLSHACFCQIRRAEEEPEPVGPPRGCLHARLASHCQARGLHLPGLAVNREPSLDPKRGMTLREPYKEGLGREARKPMPARGREAAFSRPHLPNPFPQLSPNKVILFPPLPPQQMPSRIKQTSRFVIWSFPENSKKQQIY